MYKTPFYITEAIGNNAFSFDMRKNKKLYVPSLIEIDDLEKIELQPHPSPLLEEMEYKVAFEDFDFDGNLSTNFGLKNFYKIVPPSSPLLRFNFEDSRASTPVSLIPGKEGGEKTPIYLFDNHNHAYYFWYLARSDGLIGDNNTLIHIDEHADTRDNDKHLLKPDSLDLFKVFEFTNRVLNVGDYIKPAIEEGIIGDVIQIRNESNLMEYLDHNILTQNRPHPSPLLRVEGIEGINELLYNHPSPLRRGAGGEVGKEEETKGNGIILNLDLDFFQPDLDYIDYELKKKVILDAAKKALVITVATSPFFINQDLAIKVFKDLFGDFFN